MQTKYKRMRRVRGQSLCNRAHKFIQELMGRDGTLLKFNSYFVMRNFPNNVATGFQHVSQRLLESRLRSCCTTWSIRECENALIVSYQFLHPRGLCVLQSSQLIHLQLSHFLPNTAIRTNIMAISHFLQRFQRGVFFLANFL